MKTLITPHPAVCLERLLSDVRACTICTAHLPHRPRPVLQAGATASILIAAQAPGRKVDASGIPFDDASGDRLRLWMGIDKEAFYDPNMVAILPMGFCYPGAGGSGDLPPRPECAPAWRTRLLDHMPHLQLTLVIGQYAQAWHLKQRAKTTLTETVRAWRDHWPDIFPLPHPSPRDNIWLRRNPWFEEEVLPMLKARVNTLRLRGKEKP
jgi:uracil-DNA glycosylase